MNKTLERFLFWTPRVAGILFAVFISLFAFDVFDEGLGFWETVLALFIHLIPSIMLAAAVWAAWKREWVGAVLFIGWAVWYVAFFLEREFHWSAYALVAGIPAIIGLLFLAGWIWKKQIRV
jgi:hypothetical protein